MEKYVSELLARGFCRAQRAPCRFYKFTDEYTAFIVNLKDGEFYPSVFYGWALIWRAEDVRESFLLEGDSGLFCKLRGEADLSCGKEEELAREEIGALYEKYKNAAREEILAAAKEKNKEFIGIIAKVLKPLGFRKTGTKWHYGLNERLTLWFEAQKSQFADEYYFNIIISPKDDFYKYLHYERAGGSPLDWQLINCEKAEMYFLDIAENTLKPIIDHYKNNKT
ncbi:MAG: DUF4304 domain-containing protein [Clostridia bacterium]|nr:DUF4304 domain-containing protein [Clostridia bacterium]